MEERKMEEREGEESGYEDSVSEGAETLTEVSLDTGYSGTEEDAEASAPDDVTKPPVWVARVIMKTSDTLDNLEAVAEEEEEDVETLAEDVSLISLDGRSDTHLINGQLTRYWKPGNS